MSKEELKNRLKGLRVKAGAIVLAAGMAVLSTGCSTKKNADESVMPEYSTVWVDNNQVPTPAPTPEPVLVDVTNEEDVRKAAMRAFNSLRPMLQGEKNVYLDLIASSENIEDMIRIYNGELPVNAPFDMNYVNSLLQINADLFANPGNVDNTLYDVNYSLLFRDNSLAAKYVSTYDDLYNRIANARRTNNRGAFIELVGSLLNKMYNEWCLAGLNGGFNPYALPENIQYPVLTAVMYPFDNFVTEYIQSIRMNEDPNFAICIDTCLKKDGTKDQRSAEEIQSAIVSGKSIVTGEVICTRNNEMFVPVSYTYNNFVNSLLEKSQAQVKSLK